MKFAHRNDRRSEADEMSEGWNFIGTVRAQNEDEGARKHGTVLESKGTLDQNHIIAEPPAARGEVAVEKVLQGRRSSPPTRLSNGLEPTEEQPLQKKTHDIVQTKPNGYIPHPETGLDKPVTTTAMDEPVTTTAVDEAVTTTAVDEPVTTTAVDAPVTTTAVDEPVMTTALDRTLNATAVDEQDLRQDSLDPESVISRESNRESDISLGSNRESDLSVGSFNMNPEDKEEIADRNSVANSEPRDSVVSSEPRDSVASSVSNLSNEMDLYEKVADFEEDERYSVSFDV